MSGINLSPSMANHTWWNNPAPTEEAATRTTGGFAQPSAHQDQGRVSGAAQQPASHLPPNRPGQHMGLSSTQSYLTAAQRAQASASASASARPLSQEEINTRGAQLVGHAQASMRHGQLILTGQHTSVRGQLHYQGHYQPIEAMNVAGTNFSDFAPGQTHLINEHLEFYRDEFKEGEHAQLEPVELAPTEQGQLGVVDGHHRLAAGLSLGLQVPISINLDTEPAEATNWAKVRLRDATPE